VSDLHPPAYYAENYPLSRSLLYSAMKDGLLPFFRVPSKRGARGKYLIKEADFLAWLQGNRHETEASVPTVTTPPKPKHLQF